MEPYRRVVARSLSTGLPMNLIDTEHEKIFNLLAGSNMLTKTRRQSMSAVCIGGAQDLLLS